MARDIGVEIDPRPAFPTGAGGVPPRPRPRMITRVAIDRWTVVAVALVVLGALGPWLLGLGSETPGGTHADGILAIPGGELRIDRVTELPDHGQMPAMMGVDEVPQGLRRIAVEVTIVAMGPDAVRYDAADFLVSTSGLEPRAPSRAEPGPASVPSGASVTARFLFDVPDAASALRLGHRQTDTSVPLETTALDVHEDDGSETHGPGP